MGCNASTANTKKPQRSATLRKSATAGAGQGPPPQGVQPANAAMGVNVNLAQNNNDVNRQNPAAVQQADDEGDEDAYPMVRKASVVKDSQQETKITDIKVEFKDKTDEEIVGDMPEEVKLFGKDIYSTKNWTPVLFAIYNKNIKAVRYYIEIMKANPRYATKRKDRKSDDTIYDQESFPLILILHNEDAEMLDYIWSMNELWDFEHLKVVLQTLFSRTHWAHGIDIILMSDASQDEYNALPYGLKNAFLIELFYRYLYQSTEEIKKLIRKSLVERPYALMSLYFLMAEKREENDTLIKEALSNITMEDYAKMRCESGKEFMDSWIATLSDFTSKDNKATKVSNTVKK